jgi:Zn ribbon nucleic-acid-binding protein
MAATNSTIPRSIIDRNGKMTTVHVNPDGKANTESRSLISAPPAIIHQPAYGTPLPTVMVGNEQWDLAPEGVSGASCPECGTFVDKETAREGTFADGIECAKCGLTLTLLNMELAIEYDSRKFISKEETLNAVWYHATIKEDWHNGLLGADKEAMVHLGTMEAALTRLEHLEGSVHMDTQFTIMAVRFKPGTTVADDLIGDGNDFQPRTKEEALDHQAYDAEGITRYVNQYEAVGSISLSTTAKTFDVVEVIDYDRWS